MKKVCAVILIIVFLFSFAGCGGGFSIPTEDGGKMKITKNGIQVEGSDGSKATISNDNSQFVMESSQGEVKVGENLDLPEGYPKDLVPIFKEDSILSSTKADSGEYAIIYRSKASVKDCLEYYKDFAKDAENKMESQDEDGGMIIATIKDREIAIIISNDSDDEKKASVAITIGAQASEESTEDSE